MKWILWKWLKLTLSPSTNEKYAFRKWSQVRLCVLASIFLYQYLAQKTNSSICCIAEDLNEGDALNGNNGAAAVPPIKEEKEEEEEQPVSKRRKEGRSQRVNKAKPVVKEECEGDASLIN